jgi:hypothetical protein
MAPIVQNIIHVHKRELIYDDERTVTGNLISELDCLRSIRIMPLCYKNKWHRYARHKETAILT